MNKHLVYSTAVLAILIVLPVARAQPMSDTTLQQEIRRMMTALGWPRMIEIALDRGDLQRAAKTRLGHLSDAQAACVDRSYTPERVLEKISDGYAELYSDSEIVVGITRFSESKGGKRILDKVAERSKQVGAAAAHLESKATAYDSLTPEDRAIFAKFTASPSGKAYLEGRPAQLRIHKAKFIVLADEIGRQCLQ